MVSRRCRCPNVETSPKPLGQLTGLEQRVAAWLRTAGGDQLHAELEVQYSQFALQLPTYNWQAPGRTGHPDLAYALVAYHYRAAVLSGTRNPVGAVAEELRCSRATASTRLSEVRKRGLLTSSSGGRSGGRLTAKAKRLLNIQNAEVF